MHLAVHRSHDRRTIISRERGRRAERGLDIRYHEGCGQALTGSVCDGESQPLLRQAESHSNRRPAQISAGNGPQWPGESDVGASTCMNLCCTAQAAVKSPEAAGITALLIIFCTSMGMSIQDAGN